MVASADIIRFQAFGLVLSCFLADSFAFLPSLVPPLSLPRYAAHVEHQDALQTPFLLEEDDFARLCQVDTTLRNTREQIPLLLRKPLSLEDVKSVYAEDVVLVGPNNEELACGHDELVTLSATLVAATAAARQANAFASSFQAQSTNATYYQVDSVLALDSANLQTFRVQWKVNLPALGQSTSQLVGLSEFTLNDAGFVGMHRLLDVSIDGRTLIAVGETLATLRRAVKSLGDSPLLSTLRESALASSIPGMLRDGLLQQALQNEEKLSLPPLFVTESLTAFNTSTTPINNMMLIDDIAPTLPPLPGSLAWQAYAASFRSVSQFIEYGIPVLSRGSDKDDFTKLFADDAELKGSDGSILATGGERIAEFYQTLASLRKGTNGNWEVREVSADWASRSVVVSWVASTPIQVRGKDRFQLCDSEEPVIQTIEQLELVIGGNRVQDPEWFRTFLTTVETGRSTAGGDMLVELLQKAGRGQPSTAITASVAPPKLNEKAAASVYGILCALHRDLPTLAGVNAKSPPAEEYLASNVELRGYLDELLAKGPVAYRQLSNVLTTSLQGALRTGRVMCESPPEPTIEFTAKGLIRVSLVLKLKVKVTPGDSDVGAVPLVFELVSEYTVNSQGKIKQHRLIESRVNGQLTPGDVVSRWLKGTATTNYSNPISIQSLLDAVAWARSFSNSGGNRQ